MTRERIYIYDTTLRDGQQTLTVRPQPRSVRGRTELNQPPARSREACEDGQMLNGRLLSSQNAGAR